MTIDQRSPSPRSAPGRGGRVLAWCVGYLLLPFATAADPPATPLRIDLSHWKLTLPVDAQGRFDGPAAEIPPAKLTSGVRESKYFQIENDGSLVFWCPVRGATTDGTDYPRTELREMLDPKSPHLNWSANGRHVLTARCQVQEVPSSQKVIIGQIHSFLGKAQPLIKLQYFKGRMEALVKLRPSEGRDKKFVWDEVVGLNSEINYEIRLEGDKLDVTVNGKTQTEDICANDIDWSQQTFYFKAGAYPQDNEGPVTEGARVVFSRLEVDHSDLAK